MSKIHDGVGIMEKKEIMFSIIVPIYNVAEYLEQCISSVLIQKNKSYELILVNDGSTDGCYSICEKYRTIDNVSVIHKKNGGLSDARNIGTKIAKGKYIIFLDSDDFWDDFNFLNNLEREINHHEFDIGIFGYKKLYVDGSYKQVFPVKKRSIYLNNIQDSIFLGAYNICAWDKVVKRTLLIQNNIEFEKGVLSEDMEWCAKLISVANSCYIFNEAPYIYRQRKGSISQTVTVNNIKNFIYNYSKCLDIEKDIVKEKKEAFYCYLAKNISMIIISLSFLSNKEQREYDLFVYDNYKVLNLCNRFRERAIFLSIKLIGIRNTQILLKKLYIKLHQV